MDSPWVWFCGKFKVDLPNVSYAEYLSNLSLEDKGGECHVNAVSAVPHILFLLISTSTLLYLYCCEKYTASAHVMRFPYHEFRWILLLIYLLICVCSIVEGVLTNLTYQDISTTQPHLYVPQCFVLLAVLCSLVHFQYCEVWQSPRLAWIAIVYWMLAVIVEVAKLSFLSTYLRNEESHLISILRFDIAVVSALVYFIMLILEFTVVCSKVTYHEYHPPEKPDMRFKEEHANFLNFTLFRWMQWILTKGYDTPLELKHLGSLPHKHSTEHNFEKCKRNFTKEMNDAITENRFSSLWKVYMRTYKYPLVVTFIGKFIGEFIVICMPFIVHAIVSSIERREQGLIPRAIPHHLTVNGFFSNVYILAIIFALVRFVQYAINNPNEYQCAVIGVHLRSAMQALVYEKSLRLSNLAGSSFTIGEITNHISTDAMSLFALAQRYHLVLILPVRAIVVMGILYYYVEGVIATLAIVIFFTLVPLAIVCIQASSKHQKEAMAFSDDRLQKSSEMLNGVKLLKLYGWEDIYLNLLKTVRKKELQAIFRSNMMLMYGVGFLMILPIALSAVVFCTYPYLSGEDITASLVFTTLVVISIMAEQLFPLLVGLSSLVSAIVSTRRLKKFLDAAEIENPKWQPDGISGGIKSTATKHKQLPLKLLWRQGWRRLSSEDELYSESLPLMKTPFETYTNGEKSYYEDSIDYSSEDVIIRISNWSFAWDRESTAPILRNINVEIKTGQLVMIIGAVGCGKSSLLSAILGEMTTLSGFVKFKKQNTTMAYSSQRAWVINTTLRENILFGKPYEYAKYQRVIDACALKPDIDILPAGDMTEIGEKGINLSGGQKQRVSVARAMYSDKEIVLMDDPLSALDVHVGEHLISNGIKDMLMKENRTVIVVTHQLQHLKHADLILIMNNGEIIVQGEYDDDIVAREIADWNISNDIPSEFGHVPEFDSDEERKIRKRQMLQKSMVGKENMGRPTEHKGNAPAGQLIEAEELERGYVSYKVYLYLFNSMGWPMIVACILFRTFQEIANVGRQFWLARWTSTANMSLNETQQFKLLTTYMGISFFGSALVLAFIGIGIITPIFLVEIIPCFVIYYCLQMYFMRSLRELQRLESITRSPVYAHFSETLGGLPTIRAYGEEERVFNTLLEKIDTNNTAFLYLRAGYSWFGARVNFICVAIMLMASLTAIISVETSGLKSSYVGLVLATLVFATSLLYNVLPYLAEMETQMNAVERIRHYTKLVNENTSGKEPPMNWPNSGGIHIDNIYVRYADDLPPVLKGTSLFIKPGEKIGICGRTGSGKSSLTLALFRLIDTFQGHISIDGEDIARIPLKTLRRRLSIIPQDPMLFSGSIRNNLDPEMKKSETELWDALETAQLKSVVSKLQNGLDYEVVEGGENFSVGQRQLFCVARAFLRNSQIIIMDEATASIDYDTEKILQKVTSYAFSDKTVITIAHRTSTILNSDRIVVLSEGKIVEHDTPEALLATNSIFASLVHGN